MSSTDPYYIVAGEVEETLGGVQGKFNTWSDLPRSSGQARALEAEIQEECHSLAYMVTEIDRSIDAAEKNPVRFKLSQAEISDRRKWVISTRRKVDAITTGLVNKPTTTTATGIPPSASSKLAAAAKDENERFINSEGDRQQVLMQRQDAELEDLSMHVVRIGELGREMGQELHMQGQMLDELDMEMQGTSTRLAAAQKKVQYVMDRAGTKGQLMIILGLIVILVVLIFIAIG